MDNSFKDNVVIITGASLGIGAELARQLASHGAMLALAARNRERLEAVADECHIRSARVIAIPTDVTDASHCENLVTQTIKSFGRVDILICNAGVGMWTHVDKVQEITLFEQLMRVNYLGSVYCVLYALPYLKKSRGRIVAVSSLAGKTGVPERAGYSATKAAMNAFFDTLRIELAPSGVTVTISVPDFVATGGRSRNLGPDGKPIVNALPYGKDAMTTEECARRIIDGAAKRERETVMTLRGKVGPWIKLMAPGWVDRIAQRASERGR